MSHEGGRCRVRVLYDGGGPLCSREIRLLERRDRGRGRIQVEDIAEPSFGPSTYGLDARELMARIHGVLPDDTLVEGPEVFRQAYAAVGLGWLIAPTRWPGIRWLVERAYRILARNRLQWTGGASGCDAEAGASRGGQFGLDTHDGGSADCYRAHRQRMSP